MSKKLMFFVMALVMAFTTTNVFGQVSFSRAYDDQLSIKQSTQGSRYTPSVSLTGSKSGEHAVLTGQTSGAAADCPLYNDLTETIWEVFPGETLTPAFEYKGEWMHRYVYVDYGQDGKFDVTLLDEPPYTVGEPNDLVAWNYLGGYNSADEYAAQNTSNNPPAFVLPADLAPGDYRIRFKIDWDSADPMGTDKDFKLGGLVADITLRVVNESPWNPNVTYVLQPAGSSVFATTQFHADQTVTASYILSNTAEGFKIAGGEDTGYTFKGVVSGKYIGVSTVKAWNCDDVESYWDITPVEGKENTYLVYQHGLTKGLGWNTAVDHQGYFTDKTNMEWVIKQMTDVDFGITFTTKGLNADLGDSFAVTVDYDPVASGTRFTEKKTVIISATAGEGRMVTLTVNKAKVSSPCIIEDNTEDLEINAVFEGYRSPTATTQIYGTLGLFGDDMMDLFAKADADGRMFPTDEEFEAIGVNLADLAFVRSHVRPREILDRATRLNGDTYEKRNLWMNIPIGLGKDAGGFPSSNFSDDSFSGWNYTNLFGSWNHGLLHSPGVAADCAHKNGTDIMAGIKFFESWTAGSGAAGWVKKVQEKDPNGYGGYKYVRPIVNALLYFGKDGINYNFEDTGYQSCAEFHSLCYDYAAEIGFDNFHVGLYTAQSSLSSSNVGYMLGTKDDTRPGKGQAYDTFLNYSGGDFASANSIRGSVNAVENAGWTTEDVYQGTWIVGMGRSWSNLVQNETNKRMGIVLWGEHAQSRLYSYTTGLSSLDFQKNYQQKQDRFFCGGYRNPAARPTPTNASGWDLETFQGLAEYVPERSAIKQNLPFTTYFSTGNGDRYNYKGKKTLGTWYNLGQQDVVPTYRWLVYDANTTTANTTGVPYFNYTDSYIGGSSLYLDNTSAVDIVLYRTELTVSSTNPVARIALKRVAGAPAGTVSVIVKKKGETAWNETAFEQINGTEWEAQQAPLAGIAQGDVIEYVGLRTSGDTQGLMVGMLQLDDDIVVTPAEINAESVLVEVVEECQKSLSAKLRWNVNTAGVTGYREKWNMIYNDEVNIDHFELLYKNGEDGRVSEVGRTTSWSGYVGNIPTDETTKPYVGVRGVSVDGKTYTKVVWVEIPRAEASCLPEALSASGNYPSIILDNSSDGLSNALNYRYLTKFVVENSDADFTYENLEGTPYMRDIKAGIEDKNADKTNYIFAEENVIRVHQGQKVKFTFEFPTGTDPLWYCVGRGYADWDCSEGFDAGSDELVLELGADNCKHKVDEMTCPYSWEVTVPTDAVTGNSRLRLVFSDAWFAHPGAAGAHNKGFSIDFPMVITGTNPSREPEADTHDQGIADQPEKIDDTPTYIESVAPGASEFIVKDGKFQFENVDKVWIYTPDGRLVNFMDGNVENVSADNMHGTYLVRMQSGQVIRTRKIVL